MVANFWPGAAGVAGQQMQQHVPEVLAAAEWVLAALHSGPGAVAVAGPCCLQAHLVPAAGRSGQEAGAGPGPCLGPAQRANPSLAVVVAVQPCQTSFWDTSGFEARQLLFL